MTRLSKTRDQTVLARKTSKNAKRDRLRGFHEKPNAMARARGVHPLSKILADEKLSWTRLILTDKKQPFLRGRFWL
jgi:hypothetical protein